MTLLCHEVEIGIYCIILKERRKIEIGELEGLRERKLKELYEIAHAILQ